MSDGGTSRTSPWAQREAVTLALMDAVRELVEELNPEHQRDHRSHWDAPRHSRHRRADIFDRVRWSADEIVVLSAQMVESQPWRTQLGRKSLEEASREERSLATSSTLRILARLVDAETNPLERLERDTPAVQLQRRHYPALRAAKLPVAVKAMRRQHQAAEVLLELFEHIRAA
ncbi:MAG TPA: hypothetical protein VL984_03320 [Acidimicrobiales bacterium]|nr:hypothetical protein [Acidimicrobiales bacterium]